MLLGVRCYHCGRNSVIERFCSEDEFIPISSHSYDNYWAGPGMYLWDNLSNAKWWHKTRQDKIDRGVCKCLLQVDESELLDLTDSDIADSMQDFISKMEKNEEISAEDEVGIKISFIAEIMNAKAVKLFGDYPKIKSSPFFNAPDKTKAHVDITTRVIYCVKEGYSSILKERELEEVD